MGGIKFNPDTDIPDLEGKVIFITGGTAGLGKQSITALAKHNPAHIYFSGRDTKRAAEVITDITAASSYSGLTFIECDLTSLASVAEAAKQLVSQTPRLDIVMCNAGIMAVPPGLTKDGYEIQFGTNHLGHALFIKLLLPTLLQTAQEPDSDVRLIFLTSTGFSTHPKGGIVFKDLHTTQNLGPLGAWLRYGQSKLANILYAKELAQRYSSITSVAIHPGVVSTGLVGNLGLMNKIIVYVFNKGKIVKPTEGVNNQLWAATAPKDRFVNGSYYEPVGVLGKLDKDAQDQKLAEELWEWTQKQLEPYQI